MRRHHEVGRASHRSNSGAAYTACIRQTCPQFYDDIDGLLRIE